MWASVHWALVSYSAEQLDLLANFVQTFVIFSHSLSPEFHWVLGSTVTEAYLNRVKPFK